MALGLSNQKQKSIGVNLDSSINTELGVQGGDGLVVRDHNKINITKLDGGAIAKAFDANMAATVGAFDVSKYFIDKTSQQNAKALEQSQRATKEALDFVDNTLSPDRAQSDKIIIGVMVLTGVGITAFTLAQIFGGK